MKQDYEKKAADNLPGFTKQQLLESKEYGHSRDILSVLLQNGISYTQKETQQILEDFWKGKVN